MKSIETARIISLEAENIKRLKAVTIKPDGQTVIISGRNAQGKSSVLDAIEMALGGLGRAPKRPVRDGEEKGRVVVDLGDLIVTRTFTAAGGGGLKVEGKDGARYPTPQKILDSLVGRLTFDPLEFSRMKPEERARTMKDLAGLDFGQIEAERAGMFAERTDVNRDLKAAQARLDAAPEYEDAPELLVSMADLAREVTDAEAVNARNRNTRERLDRLVEQRQTAGRESGILAARVPEVEKKAESDIKTIDMQMEAELKRVREAARSRIKEVQRAREEKLAELKESQGEAERLAEHRDEEIARLSEHVSEAKDVDTDAIRGRIMDAERVNERVRANLDRKKIAAEVAELEGQSKKLTENIAAADQHKADVLAAAKLPIEGLGVTEEGVTYQDVPFEQCSGAEQIRISLAMAMALNPKLKVCLLRGGNDLDDDSLKMVLETCQKAGYQAWIEKIAGGEGSVVIEDGAVQEGGE